MLNVKEEVENKPIITIKFRLPIDTEELRELIEDNLGIEILEIDEVNN